MKLFSNLRERIYFLPGIAVSVLLQLLPSFRLKSVVITTLFARSRVHPSVTVHNRVRFLVPRDIEIGSGSTINSCCLIDTRNPVRIGKQVMVGHGTKIFTLGHDFNSKDFRAVGGPVDIEDNVIIFPDVKIMPGVRLHKGAVVLNGSIVTKDVPEMCVVGGNPATVISQRKQVHSTDFNYRCIFGL